MPTKARVVLLLFALICGGQFTLLGAGISYGLEPSLFYWRHVATWFLLGAAISLPFWFAAVIPNSAARLQRITRWISASLLCGLIYLYQGVITNQIERTIHARGAEPVVLVCGIALTAICLVAIAILLWPEASRLVALIRHRRSA